MSDHCKRSMHTFNPAPGTVKRSALLGVCLECQAETTVEWHNRARWNAGHKIPAVHIGGCTRRHDELGFYVKMSDQDIRNLMKECGL